MASIGTTTPKCGSSLSAVNINQGLLHVGLGSVYVSFWVFVVRVESTLECSTYSTISGNRDLVSQQPWAYHNLGCAVLSCLRATSLWWILSTFHPDSSHRSSQFRHVVIISSPPASLNHAPQAALCSPVLHVLSNIRWNIQIACVQTCCSPTTFLVPLSGGADKWYSCFPKDRGKATDLPIVPELFWEMKSKVVCNVCSKIRM